ncbi:MAG: tripartite tricarboxylate transporter substrate binding protein, partial [Burkholderiaceae bacterium]|nr:tripartite tricarboxylate transporter substrate binding protein [Burkholderiaceae bacterium]
HRIASKRFGRCRTGLGRLVALAMLFCSSVFVVPAQAQTWPSKPVRVIVPFAPGGATDIMARAVAQRMSENLGQPFVVENRAGATGNVGSDLVAKSAPDGHMLLVSGAVNFAINQHIFRNMPYSPERDLTGISVLGTYANALIVNKDLPVNNLKELIAYVGERPGKLNYGSGGVGGTGHLSMELFLQMSGLKVAHIAYKGNLPAMTDLLANHIQMTFDALPTYVSNLREGRVRVLGVSTPTRIAAFPDIPTIAEAGVPGFDATAWNAMAVSSRTPPELLRRINAEAVKALRDPAVAKRIADLGFTPVAQSLEETRAYFASESAKWKKVAENGRIVVD